MNAFLFILAVAFYVAPAVLAVLVDRQVRAFESEAFGHLRKAARNLRLMAWFIFVYFLGIVIAGFIVGDMQQTVQWPLSGRGLTMYIRVGAAITGYLFALQVSRQLYLVTQPKGIAGDLPASRRQ